jgi:cell division protein FtsI/penicillin-binding protein 2
MKGLVFSQMQGRLALLRAAVVFAVLCVEGRLAYLQVLKHAEFHQLAFHQQYVPRETQASRGVIEDRSGALLAMNIGLYDVYAHPDQIKDKAKTAAALSQALGLPYGDMLSKVSGDKPFAWVARQVPYERSQAVEGLRLEGVESFQEECRFYPDHDMAAHVLGFTGIDDQGLDGLERYYDGSLRGHKGLVMTERDARGRVVLSGNKPVRANLDGLNVVTTLDKTLQHIAQVELEKAYVKFRCKAASIAVMDPKTGQILALADCPNFDPNHYGDFDKDCWRDRMVNNEFEPGSTFKLVAAVGALDEGAVNEDDKFFCENGAYKTQYGRVVRDHEKFGWLTFREIFGYSSNIGMVKVSAKLGEKNLYRYCRRFGFGEKTGIDLPGEAEGKLRPLKDWSGLSMTTIPYGYEVSTTPIQMLAAYGAIANGGVLMRPYVVQKLVDDDGRVVRQFHPKKVRRVCSTETADRITKMLEWVVEKGTGTAVALPDFDIAGKTGTAYKFMDGHYSKYEYVSSFIGFVPAEKPKFVIYVSLDDPRGIYWGGYTAGPVFKEVAKRALVYDLVPGKQPEDKPELAEDKRLVPSFAGLTKTQCRWLAHRDGLKVRFEGEGDRAVSQSAAAGSEKPAEDKLVLDLGRPRAVQAKGLMPDLRGKTKRQALALLAPLGLQVNFTGEGIVRAQYPPAGRAVEGNLTCSLSCDPPLARRAGLSKRGDS